MDEKRKFNPVTPSVEEDIRPGFLGGKGGGEAPSGSKSEKKAEKRAKTNETAADSLRGAEDSAGNEVSQRENSLRGARAGEQDGGFYSGSEGENG